MSQELLSLGRESVVWKDGDRVYKCYAPELGQYADEFKAFSADIEFPLRNFSLKTRRKLFAIEAAMLQQMSHYDRVWAPRFYSTDETTLTIIMEYIPHPTFQQAVVSGEIDTTDATRMMVSQLAAFHNAANSNLCALRKATQTASGYQQLRPSTPERDLCKWVGKFQGIVYYLAPEFQQYRAELEGSRRKVKRRKIDEFLKGKGIPLSELVQEFIAHDHLLAGQTNTFIWGEARSANMFYDPTLRTASVLIDFPRARVGAGSYVDLASLLNNMDRKLFSIDKELISTEIANDYFTRVGIERQEFPVSHARLFGARINGVRELANYCQKSSQEIKRAIGAEKTTRLNGHTKQVVLEGMVTSLHDLLRYYIEGAGWEAVLEKAPDDIKGLVKRKAEIVRRVFTDCGIFTGRTCDDLKARYLNQLVQGLPVSPQVCYLY